MSIPPKSTFNAFAYLDGTHYHSGTISDVNERVKNVEKQVNGAKGSDIIDKKTGKMNTAAADQALNSFEQLMRFESTGSNDAGPPLNIVQYNDILGMECCTNPTLVDHGVGPITGYVDVGIAASGLARAGVHLSLTQVSGGGAFFLVSGTTPRDTFGHPVSGLPKVPPFHTPPTSNNSVSATPYMSPYVISKGG